MIGRRMFIQALSSNPQYYFAVVLVVVISICLHELGHGFAALALGDRTPEETGHITLNPLVHMGPISLLMLAFVGISWGAMPVDPTRLRGRYAEALVAVAGPAVNLVLALFGGTALGLWARFGTIDVENHMVSNAVTLLSVLCIYNILLFMLNLLPLPPLDGSRIVGNFVPAYRAVTRDPTMSGVFLAVLFGVFYAAGGYLAPIAINAGSRFIGIVAGHG
jgi:Zn-dependent protease